MATGRAVEGNSHLAFDKPCKCCGRMERVIYNSSPSAYCSVCLRVFQRIKSTKYTREQMIEMVARGANPEDLPPGWRERLETMRRTSGARLLANVVQQTLMRAPESARAPEPVAPVPTNHVGDDAGDDQAVQSLLAQLLLLTDRAREVIGEGKIDQLRTVLDVEGVRVHFGAARIVRDGGDD